MKEKIVKIVNFCKNFCKKWKKIGKQRKNFLKNWKKINQIFSSKMAKIGKNDQKLVKTGKVGKFSKKLEK